MKSPVAPPGHQNLLDDDYSLSVSELNASLYNSSNRGAGIINMNLGASAMNNSGNPL